MKVLFMRHAIAHAANPESWPNDVDRPLRRKGVRKLRELAPAFRVLGYSWDDIEVWVSPAKRCIETAEHLKIILEGHNSFRIVQELGEDQDPSLLINKFSHRTNDHVPLLLIGHGLNSQKLLSVLLTGRKNRIQFTLKKASLVELDYDISTRTGSLLALYPPSTLQLIAKCIAQ